jgi:hypothetical protein
MNIKNKIHFGELQNILDKMTYQQIMSLTKTSEEMKNDVDYYFKKKKQDFKSTAPFWQI